MEIAGAFSRSREALLLTTAYPDSVRFLYSLGNEYKTIKLGLERVERLLAALGHPERAARFVHVAGTNGKGSTCSMIEAALRLTGIRTGLYSSPHLSEPTERIRIGGEPVSPAEFAAAFDEVHSTAERLLAHCDIDMHPTYFETVTCMAFVLFRARQVEIVVLETGMGGRLDATNVVDPELAVLTPIDFDHEKFLGTSIPQIAFEKAGIIKPGRPVIVSRQHLAARQVIEAEAAARSAPLRRADTWRVEQLELTTYGSRFRAVGPRVDIPIDCPLVGAHQVENALTAVAALHELGLSPHTISAGIAATAWPGRLERVAANPDIFLDGAHNLAGARALAGYIRHFHHGRRRIWLVFGAMRDKDLHGIAPLLFPLADELLFTTPRQARAFAAEEILQLTGATSARAVPEVANAVALARQAAPGDAVFITGSLYLVGEARSLLVA